jgi:hypothetical protein
MRQLFDRMSYEGLWLGRFDDNKTLDEEKLRGVFDEACVLRIIELAGPDTLLNRHALRACFAYLVYFGIGRPNSQQNRDEITTSP